MQRKYDINAEAVSSKDDNIYPYIVCYGIQHLRHYRNQFPVTSEKRGKPVIQHLQLYVFLTQNIDIIDKDLVLLYTYSTVST